MSIRNVIGLASLTLVVTAAASCGDVVRTGRAPVVLVMSSLSGATASTSGPVASDVLSRQATSCPVGATLPCILIDSGLATIVVVPKDASPTAPALTSNNQVTITRYHVSYRRSDGRNTEGVDVPYAFDGAVTATIPAEGTGSVTFSLVRSSAKRETPLVQLATNTSAVITTITEVTFYGQDLVGNEVSVTGSIQIDFADFPG